MHSRLGYGCPSRSRIDSATLSRAIAATRHQIGRLSEAGRRSPGQSIIPGVKNLESEGLFERMIKSFYPDEEASGVRHSGEGNGDEEAENGEETRDIGEEVEGNPSPSEGNGVEEADNVEDHRAHRRQRGMSIGSRTFRSGPGAHAA